MSQPTFQPSGYLIPCPRCATAVQLPRNGGPRQRALCAECGHLVVMTWTDGAIVLAAYQSSLPRRYPQTRLDPAYPPVPQARQADDPRPRRGPRPDDGPDWAGARRRVSRAMNGLR